MANNNVDWVERLKQERNQLAGRLKSLEAFMSADKFNDLENGVRMDMTYQHYHMTEYLKCLESRLRRLELE